MEVVSSIAATSQATLTTDLVIRELAAKDALYCKAGRILILKEKQLKQIQRNLCKTTLAPFTA